MTPPQAVTGLTLAAVPTAVRCSRMFVSSCLRQWGLPFLAADSELVASELVTNAVAATGVTEAEPRWSQLGDLATIYVRVMLFEGSIVIAVWDRNPAPPAPRQSEPDSENGRGLSIVAALCKRWDYYLLDGGGKCVWAELAIQPGALPSAELPRRVPASSAVRAAESGTDPALPRRRAHRRDAGQPGRPGPASALRSGADAGSSRYVMADAVRLWARSSPTFGILEGMDTGRSPGAGVFVAADVHYLASGGARAAAVVAADAAFSRLVADRIALVPDVEPYRPGQFWLREFPALSAVLGGLAGMALLVVDGYADLDPDGRPGLGAHARAEFGVPVIGVAKSAFRTATHAIPVLRGTSARPLYVTAAGMPRAGAADLIQRMAGRHRLPDALRRADTLARHGLPRSRDS